MPLLPKSLDWPAWIGHLPFPPNAWDWSAWTERFRFRRHHHIVCVVCDDQYLPVLEQRAKRVV